MQFETPYYTYWKSSLRNSCTSALHPRLDASWLQFVWATEEATEREEIWERLSGGEIDAELAAYSSNFL